ncbi:MAG: hypothetical protein ACO1QS_07450, partial [Verrucomicrobiota bacterium]
TGTATPQQIKKRAVELAIINGLSALQVFRSDWAQAKRELSGKDAIDPQTATLEAAPESERWDPVPGTSGRKARTAPSADEDAEGRSTNEQLVEKGVAQAEHDQMLRAAKESPKE